MEHHVTLLREVLSRIEGTEGADDSLKHAASIQMAEDDEEDPVSAMEQTDIGARLNRYNGFVPFMGFIIVSVMTIVLYSVLFILRRRKKRRGHDDETMEGCPPAAEAIAAGSVCGLTSYSITAHPDYLQVFPKDAPFSRGL